MIWRWRRWRAKRALRKTHFWCDKHWRVMDKSGADPLLATRNLTVGLYMLGREMRPARHACCTFTDDTIKGVLELSHGG